MQNVKPAHYDVVNYVYVFMGDIKAGKFLSCYNMLVISTRKCCGSVYAYDFEVKNRVSQSLPYTGTLLSMITGLGSY